MALELGSAVYTYLWDRPLEAALSQMADFGFKWVEIMATPPHCWPRDMDAAARRRLRAHLDVAGLRLAALNPTFTDINLASTNPGLREESIRQAKETVELASDLGAWAVVLSFGRRNPLMPAPFEYAWQLSQSAVAECLKVAEKQGIVLLMENNPSHFVRTSAQCLEAASSFDSPNLRLVFDVANARLVEDPVAGLERVRDYLGYVHLSDTDEAGRAHRTVGTGRIDFAAINHALLEMGYRGVCTLETTDPSNPQGSIKDSAAALLQLGWEL